MRRNNPQDSFALRNMRYTVSQNFIPVAEPSTARLDLRRLRSSLLAAAAKAGYQGWWLVDDLIEGIAHYFRSEPAAHLGDGNRLSERIQAMLKAVGYQEIALQYRSLLTRHAVSLVGCLPGSARSDRARFFDKLAEEISRLHAARAQRIHFCDLRECVHELQKACPISWTPDGKDQLRNVVAFIRERVQTLWQSQEVQCSIV